MNEGGAAREMFNLDTWPPTALREFEAEPTAHLPPRRNPSEREAGDVERQVEANDRRAQIVASREEDVLDKLRGSHALETLGSAKGLQRASLSLRERIRVKEQARLVEVRTISQMIAAEAKPLRGVRRRLGVEDERPFRRRRWLPIASAGRLAVRVRHEGAKRDRQAVGRQPAGFRPTRCAGVHEGSLWSAYAPVDAAVHGGPLNR